MLGRLQVLRAVAAYMVVVYHAFEALSGNGYGVSSIPVGAAGVDLFFVISGFIMVYIARPEAKPGAFLLNRVGRIVPLYWLATFIAVGLVAFRPWLFPTSILGWDTLVASLAFFTMMGNGGFFTPILAVGWTLNLEMAFYVLFALSLIAPPRFRLPVLVALMTALFAAGLAAPASSFMSFYGNTILYEFAAGCLIGQAVRTPAIFAQLKRIPALGLVAIGSIWLALSGTALDNLPMRPLIWGAPSVLIVLGVVMLDMTRARTTNNFLASLGDASYSAYLLHPFVLAGMTLAAFPVLDTSYAAAAVFLLVTIGLTIAISLLSYRYFETPARVLLQRYTHPKGKKAAPMPKASTPAGASGTVRPVAHSPGIPSE